MRAIRARVSVWVRVLSQSRRRWVRGKGRREEGAMVMRRCVSGLIVRVGGMAERKR